MGVPAGDGESTQSLPQVGVPGQKLGEDVETGEPRVKDQPVPGDEHEQRSECRERPRVWRRERSPRRHGTGSSWIAHLRVAEGEAGHCVPNRTPRSRGSVNTVCTGHARGPLAWLPSEAAVVAYMDVDLSTNLYALLPLSTPLYAGKVGIGIGSRLMHPAVITRQWKREALPRGYNALIQALFGNRFSDAQSGSKSLTRASARALLPAVEDDAWFFDTELLLLAEARGYRIHEVPVGWVEDLDRRDDLVPTVLADLQGLRRLRTRRLR